MRNAGSARRGSVTAASTRPRTAATGRLGPSAPRNERSRSLSRRRGTLLRWPTARRAAWIQVPAQHERTWNRVWADAVAESGIPFKPTAYQVRHTHASWLIDAGENPKAVMHRLGQADLRTTARYVHVLDETGESAARRFEGLLPPL
jgi:integrase